MNRHPNNRSKNKTQKKYSKKRTLCKNKRNGGSNEKKNKPRTRKTIRKRHIYEPDDINENISESEFKKRYVIPRIYTKIYEYMDKVIEKDTNSILQDDLMEKMDLWEIEKIQNLITRMENNEYQEENTTYKYIDYDSVLTSNNRRFSEHDIRIVKCFLLLQRLSSIQKINLFLPGQLDTMEVQDDYLMRLGETKTEIINLMGELDIPIQNGDIIFTNRLE